jgi:hypothetical protein
MLIIFHVLGFPHKYITVTNFNSHYFYMNELYLKYSKGYKNLYQGETKTEIKYINTFLYMQYYIFSHSLLPTLSKCRLSVHLKHIAYRVTHCSKLYS